MQDFAADIAKKLGYKPGGDIEKVVRDLNGRIVVAHTASDALNTGSISVWGPGDFTISLTSFAGHRRNRFTIAHELGHYFLHSKMGKKCITVRRDGSGQVEWEANWFAAGFLMPEIEFRGYVNAGWGDAMLAEKFGVSEAAVEVRKRVLFG